MPVRRFSRHAGEHSASLLGRDARLGAGRSGRPVPRSSLGNSSSANSFRFSILTPVARRCPNVSSERIRPVALGAVWREDQLLVFEDHDPETGDRFHRFIGGGVEFGEHSRVTVVREFEEELGVQFDIDRQAGTFERVFEYDGETGHEIWRVYEGTIHETWPYQRETFEFVEPELGESFTAKWVDADRLCSDAMTFYVPEIIGALSGPD